MANFCQDVARDWAKGRIYLPRATLDSAGCSEDVFERGRHTEAFARAMQVEVDRAEAYLRTANRSSSSCPPSCASTWHCFLTGGLSILAAIRDYRLRRLEPAAHDLAAATVSPTGAMLVAHAARLAQEARR